MSASIWKPGEGTISVDAESANLEQVFITASAQTLFTLTDFEYAVGTGSLAVYRNGQRLVSGVDWEETSSTSFTLLVAVVAGETIVANGIIGSSGASAAAAAASAASAAASAEAAALFDPSSYATKAFPVFSGYIRGDFSNDTVVNRVLFQTNTVNGNSNLGVIPNGTSTIAGVRAYGDSDPTNAPSISIAQIGTTESRLSAESNGTSPCAPMTFYTGGSERLRIDTSGTATLSGPLVLYGNAVNALEAVPKQQLAEEVRNTLNVTGSAPVYACRAWVNFNGVGTVAIRGSGNVSSVTDNGTGDYTVNFITSMPDDNYATCISGKQNGAGGTCIGYAHGGTYSTSAVRVSTLNSAMAATDMLGVFVEIFR